MNKEKEEKLAEISARITKMIAYLGETPNSFAIKLGYSRAQTVYDIQKMKSAPSYDFFQRFSIAGFSAIINIDWLLTGEGSMLRSDRATDTHNIPITDTSSDSNMHSDAVTLRFMDKLDEKDNIIKEKEAKIEQLQTELREKSEELVALKAFHQHIHIRGYHDQPDIEGTRKGLGQ